MKNAKQSETTTLLAVSTSLLAALVWCGAIGFVIKWYWAWRVGQLEPADDTSGRVLFAVFAVALLAAVGGLCISVSAWRGRSSARRQFGSLFGAVLVWWAVCGG